MAAESATLQALQTKQQLGVQALSIANQSTSIMLSLFR
jgi:flagellin